jgi:hypothetical protein
MSPRWLHWPAASAGSPDWDTAATVVGRIYGSVNDGNDVDLSFYDGTMWSVVGQTINPITPEEIAKATGGAGPWTSTDNGYFDADTMGSVAPFVGFWTDDLGWEVGAILTTGGYKSFVTYSLSNPGFPIDVPAAMIFYASDPGDPSSWRAYDGPTS